MMSGFERYTKKTRRAAFLAEMEQVVPWRPLQGSRGRSGAGEEPDEVDGALEGGARVCGNEVKVWLCEDFCRRKAFGLESLSPQPKEKAAWAAFFLRFRAN
jgi:hypothetical protein